VWGGVAYGNGVFVAFDGSGSGEMATSVLGSVWSLHQYNSAQNFVGVAFGCNAFVGVGSDAGSGNSIFSSSVGAAWTSVPVPIDEGGTWTSIGYGNGHFVAVDADGDVARAPSGPHCGASIPMAPQQISGNIHNGEVWTYMHPPVGHGGATITRYRVTITNGSTTKTCSAPVYFEPNCIIKGLMNHTVYWVTTQAHNSYGYSPPSDPEMAITVPSWSFAARAAAPVVLESSHVAIQVTGVQANSEGIYPTSKIDVTFNGQTITCHATPFGECLIDFPDPGSGNYQVSATYSGYGSSYRSSSHVAIATVSVPTSVSAGMPFTVSVHDGVSNSRARVNLDGHVTNLTLDGSGDGSTSVASPNSPSNYSLSVLDDNVVLVTQSLDVTP
jgi:hypothetical protein